MHLLSRMDRLNVFLESFSLLSIIFSISNEKLAVNIDIVSDNLIKSLALVFFLNKLVKGFLISISSALQALTVFTP